MDPLTEYARMETRRHFFGRAAAGIGTAALASLLDPGLLRGEAAASPAEKVGSDSFGVLPALHFAPKAKRVIWLFMADAPSQLDLFEHKPKMQEMFDKDLPESIRNGQRITTMTSGQARFPVAPSVFKFQQYGKSGAWLSELLPQLGSIADDLTFVKTLNTEAINHDPAITFIQTGSQIPGRPSTGAWLSYGIGSPNHDLPAFVVLHSRLAAGSQSQALFSRLWGSGFLPTRHQGVALRSSGDPVLYLSNPPGVSDHSRRQMLDGLAELNQKRAGRSRRSGNACPHRTIRNGLSHANLGAGIDRHLQGDQGDAGSVRSRGDPARHVRIQLLARPAAGRAGCPLHASFLARLGPSRRLAGKHSPAAPVADQASAALVKDLKQRGMLDDTLVIWGGEFGRTIYSQGTLTKDNYGRDHHPRCFTMWMAGGGMKPGITYGQTDDFSYNVTENPVHVHDLNATILHLLGIDHQRLTYRFQGRDFRLTDVHGTVVKDILA